MRWWRFLLLAVAALVVAAAGIVLTIALNVVTGGTARGFPSIEHHSWRWSAGSGVAAAAAALLFWWAQRCYDRSPTPSALTKAKPSYGRLVNRWDPVELGVHQVIGGGPMPTYIRRPHDERLQAVLDPAITASRLIIVRGSASTGKTRAAYEAVASRLSDWQLDYPMNATALAERLEAGIPPRTVLWLGELRQYADDDGGPAVLGRLADLIAGEGHVVISTVWPEHWNTYAAAARTGPGSADPTGTTGKLLERLPELARRDPASIDPARGGVIDIPDCFTAADVDAAVCGGDPLLVAAVTTATNAGQDGQVTQYLAGVPDLLRRYAGPGGDPYGQAIIVAAMDAARLGHLSPLPAALLHDAAVGYLTGAQRTSAIETWRDTSVAWATAKLNGAVQALQPIPPATGTGVIGYPAADYLDQHGRHVRHDQLGPSALWDALAVGTASVRDLTRLAQAARDRGLYRHAAALWTAAASQGSADAARDLIIHLQQVGPSESARAASWAASRVSLGDLWGLGALLQTLRQAGAYDAALALDSRIADASQQATLGKPETAVLLLQQLREAGADRAADILAARVAAQASLDDIRVLTTLLQELRESGDDYAARVLLAHHPTHHGRLDDPVAVAGLLREMRLVGANDAASALASLAVDQASLNDPGAIAILLMALRDVEAYDAVDALLARDPVGHGRLDDPLDLALLLREMRQAGTDQVPRILAIRPAYLHDLADAAWLLEELRQAEAIDSARILAGLLADQASLNDPGGVGRLLRELRRLSADTAAQALLARDPASSVRLDDPGSVAGLLRELRESRASEAVDILLARNPADHARLDNPQYVSYLLREFHESGASGQARILADRAAQQASLDDPGGVAKLLEELRGAGASDAAAVGGKIGHRGTFRGAPPLTNGPGAGHLNHFAGRRRHHGHDEEKRHEKSASARRR